MTALTLPDHPASLSPDLALAVRAVYAAGNVIAESSGERHSVESKGIGDLVSEVDREADRAALAVLQTDPASAAILSEELSPETPDSVDDLWIVDPLDATSAFLMRAGDTYPAVLAAKYVGGRLSLGVVLFPLTGEWFYAQRGKGAWKDGRRLVINDDRPALAEAWVEMNQYGDASLETEVFTSLRSHLRSGAGARLVTSNVPHSGVAMRIAEGNSGLAAAIHDNNPSNVKQAPWDIAAPQIILEEAGGVFVNFDGEPTDPFHTEPVIVAATRSLADEIIDLVKQDAVSAG
ncbi:MAG: inositol monophosphatase family protein [Planctomycetota bacterium]